MRIMTLGLFCALYMIAPAVSTAQNRDVVVPVQGEQSRASEVTGKIEAVDTGAKTIQLQGVSSKILVTDQTKFEDGLTLASLKVGMSVKVSAKSTADGKLEALEVSAA